jgi:succinate dehydrogenase / fumarate reductase, cytochrome b subunit
MNWVNSLLSSNIGRKLIMALTGLFLVSFLFVHLSGNLLLLSGDKGYSFNLFTHFMSTTGIIRILEIVLLLGFLIHIYTAAVLTQKNQSRRKTPYAAGNKTPGVSWFSKNMGITGSLILIFLVLHIRTFWYRFKFGEVRKVYYTETPGEGESSIIDLQIVEQGTTVPSGLQVFGDMNLIAIEAFSNPLYVIFYIAAFVVLAFHLLHGFSSGFQTLGFAHKKYSPIIKILGIIIGIGVPLGFTIIPLVLLFTS